MSTLQIHGRQRTQMTEQTPDTGILSRLSLNHWYKYLLYLGGISLLLGFYFRMQFSLVNSTGSTLVVNKVIEFSIYTVVIGITLWIFDAIKEFVKDYLEYKSESENYSDSYIDNLSIALEITRYMLWIIAFIIWIHITIST
jgi:MFS superfamily sulfate permease-like transporter